MTAGYVISKPQTNQNKALRPVFWAHSAQKAPQSTISENSPACVVRRLFWSMRLSSAVSCDSISRIVRATGTSPAGGGIVISGAGSPSRAAAPGATRAMLHKTAITKRMCLMGAPWCLESSWDARRATRSEARLSVAEGQWGREYPPALHAAKLLNRSCGGGLRLENPIQAL